MRTTVEIDDTQRAELLRLAAERGYKGFSELIREALAEYLAGEEARSERVRTALSQRESLSAEEADDLVFRTLALREEWR